MTHNPMCTSHKNTIHIQRKKNAFQFAFVFSFTSLSAYVSSIKQMCVFSLLCMMICDQNMHINCVIYFTILSISWGFTLHQTWKTCHQTIRLMQHALTDRCRDHLRHWHRATCIHGRFKFANTWLCRTGCRSCHRRCRLQGKCVENSNLKSVHGVYLYSYVCGTR